MTPQQSHKPNVPRRAVFCPLEKRGSPKRAVQAYRLQLTTTETRQYFSPYAPRR